MPTTRYSVFDGEIVSENRAGVQHDYVSDPLGNTIALLDNTQTQTDQWAYFPYGESVRLNGTTATPMTYVGRKSCRQDSSGTRSHMQNRFLDMPKARWMTEDPIGFGGGDWNLYRYVHNNPATQTDPTGRASIVRVGPWYLPIHYFIRLSGCDALGGHNSIGFWPGAHASNPILNIGGIQIPDPHNGDSSGLHAIHTINDPQFDRLLCDCISNRCQHDMIYFYPGFSNCSGFADQLWTCALIKSVIEGPVWPGAEPKPTKHAPCPQVGIGAD